jgi:hypothetical protein
MKRLALFTVACFLLLSTIAQALTVDEIIRLKQAGVSDSTIELLIKADGDNRSAGTWKTKDGWIVHTTETREPAISPDNRYQTDYPIAVYPGAYFRRR